MSHFTNCEPSKPRCRGCIHHGPTFPCEYILNTGHSPQSMGVQLNPYGKGGCPLKDTGDRITKRTDPVYGSSAVWRVQKYTVDSEKALELYKKGATDTAIARELEVPPRVIYRWRKRHELESRNLRGPSNVDKRHGQSAFDVPDVMEAYRAGESDAVLARMVGCSTSAARSWRKSRGLPPNNNRGST